jgi:zinc/manganese transport system permease protein
VALVIGAVAATVSAVVGVLAMVRGLAFAGHALTDVAATGGSGAVLVGASPLGGFLGGALVGAGAIALAGHGPQQRRDVATGIVLSAATGLSALFLYLDATTNATTGVTQRVLFGSLFSASSSTVPVAIELGAATLLLTAVIARPLVLSSLSRELARARGIPVGVVSGVFLVTLAMAVGLSALTIGSLLSTALLVGPAAAAVRVTTRMSYALVIASGIGIVSTWLGITLAYDSYNWMPHHQSLPVSFFVVVDVVVAYGLCSLVAARRARGRRV